MIFIICKGGYGLTSFEANRLTTVQNLCWQSSHQGDSLASSAPRSGAEISISTISVDTYGPDDLPKNLLIPN